MRRAPRWLAVLLVALSTFFSAAAFAGPRSGGSFGSRQGFRSGGGYSSPSPGYSGGGYSSPYSGGYGYGGGSHFLFFPSFGGYGLGYGGGFGLFGVLAAVAVVGLVIRAVRAGRAASSNRGTLATGTGRWWPCRVAPTSIVSSWRSGRSARGIQDRLAEFAAQGDTESEAGLAALLQQTAVELMREKDAVRYLGTDARGPMSLTNAETAMNAMALAERGRFQVERVRAAGGRVSRSEVPAEEGKEALELVRRHAGGRDPHAARKIRDRRARRKIWGRCSPSWAVSRPTRSWVWKWSGHPPIPMIP